MFFLAESNLGCDLIVIARRECRHCKMCDGVLGLFEVVCFSFVLISARVAATGRRKRGGLLGLKYFIVCNVSRAIISAGLSNRELLSGASVRF